MRRSLDDAVAANPLTRDEARRSAMNIAKLAELLGAASRRPDCAADTSRNRQAQSCGCSACGILGCDCDAAGKTLSTRVIAKALNDRGIATPRGGGGNHRK
jgi:hypothetical protein